MMPSNPPLTVKDCGGLTDPANGQVSHTDGTTFGETATYSCDTGYNLMGDSTRMCEATGMWSGSAPTCQSVYFTHHVRLMPLFIYTTVLLHVNTCLI